MLAAKIVEQSEISLRAAWDTLGCYHFVFERGKIDLIYLNLLETKVNETEIKLIDAQQRWFSALADMQAALGLEQAMLLAALPMSDVPGPGNLPAIGVELKRKESRLGTAHATDKVIGCVLCRVVNG